MTGSPHRLEPGPGSPVSLDALAGLLSGGEEAERRRILIGLARQTAAGAAGAWLASAAEVSLRYWMEPPVGELFRSASLSGALVVGAVAALLTAGEEVPSGSPLRMLFRAALAVVVGLAAGTMAAAAAAGVNLFLAMAGGGAVPPLLGPVLRWGLLGLAAGLVPGIVSRSPRRAASMGSAGLCAGLAGGFLYQLMLHWPGPAVGLLNAHVAGPALVGAFLGLATAAVDESLRTAWLAALPGSPGGAFVPLHRPECVLGRDELVDVPLMGDPAVDRRHAIITLEPHPAIREVGREGGVRVDGRVVREAPLEDGMLVEIGRHRFHFRSRLHPGSERGEGRPDPDLPPPAAVPDSVRRVASFAPGQPLLLRVTAGRDAGAALPLEGDAVTIGRETDNALPLADPRVSRRHARIERRGESWVLADLASKNGTRLNGVRVVRAGLVPGDFLYVGDTVLAVEPVVSPSECPGGPGNEPQASA